MEFKGEINKLPTDPVIKTPEGNVKHDHFDPNKYLGFVRKQYHEGAEFKGRRTPEQISIADSLREESDQLFDAIKALGTSMNHPSLRVYHTDEEALISDDKIKLGNPKKEGGLDFGDYRKAFTQLYVGLGVITNRIARDNPDFKQVFELTEDERLTLLGTLFHDFQALNEYRLGAKGFGLKKFKTSYNEDGDVVRTPIDRDAGATEGEKVKIANSRGFTPPFTVSGEDDGRTVVHAAGKISPEEVAELRLQFPEVDTDDFFRIVWSARNPAEALENANR